MPRQGSSFGWSYSRDYNRGFSDASGTPSGSEPPSSFFQALGALLLIFMLLFTPLGDMLLYMGIGAAILALCLVIAAYAFRIALRWATPKSYRWHELSLQEIASGILSEMSALHARWIAPLQTDTTTSRPQDESSPPSIEAARTESSDAKPDSTPLEPAEFTDSDFIEPQDRLYRRIDAESIRRATFFHWKRGRVFQFTTLTNKDEYPAQNVHPPHTSNTGSNSQKSHSAREYPTFAGMPPPGPFLDGCVFHLLIGAPFGLLSAEAAAYLYLTVLTHPDRSSVGFVTALLGAIVGIVLAAVSRAFTWGASTSLSGALNGALNGFSGGYIAYLFVRAGFGGSAFMYGSVFAFTATVGSVICLADWLFSRKYGRGVQATSLAALVQCAVLAIFAKMADVNSTLGIWGYAGLLGGLFVCLAGCSALVVRPLGALTAVLAGILGGLLCTVLPGISETSGFRPMFEFLLGRFPSGQTIALVGMVMGIFTSLFTYCRSALFLPHEFRIVAIGHEFFKNLPDQVRFLATAAEEHFDELQIICDYRATAIVDWDGNQLLNLGKFELLLLGRNGDKYWLIADYRPSQ